MERLSEDKQRAVRRTHEWADSKFDEQDYESAFMLYEGLVEHDPSGFSYYRLALMYLEGLGVPKVCIFRFHGHSTSSMYGTVLTLYSFAPFALIFLSDNAL